jgi:hypothetical protein
MVDSLLVDRVKLLFTTFKMTKDHVEIPGRRWRPVVKTLEKQYDAFVQETPEAQPVINEVRGALANTFKVFCASSKLNRYGADWVKIMQEAEVSLAACQELDGKEFFTALLECYTSTQLRMLICLQFSTEEGTSSTHFQAPQPTPQAQQQKRDHSSGLRKSKEEVKLVAGLGTTAWDKKEVKACSG